MSSGHTRKFNGETYYRESSTSSKAEAKAEVKHWRNRKHRIVKNKNGYALYSRRE